MQAHAHQLWSVRRHLRSSHVMAKLLVGDACQHVSKLRTGQQGSYRCSTSVPLDAYGNRVNCEKSGGRFSLYALNPSFPSGVW